MQQLIKQHQIREVSVTDINAGWKKMTKTSLLLYMLLKILIMSANLRKTIFIYAYCLTVITAFIKLVVHVPVQLRGYMKKFNTAVCEYGKKVHNAEIYASYLWEHEKPLVSSNALKVLYNNFR